MEEKFFLSQSWNPLCSFKREVRACFAVAIDALKTYKKTKKTKKPKHIDLNNIR